MGMYINGIGTTYQEKIENLVENHSGIIIPEPSQFIPDLVCVVDNVTFGAAGYVFDEKEFEAFVQIKGRRKIWLIVPNVLCMI